MNCAVIDIGSNSVRLLVIKDGIPMPKFVKVTALAQGLSKDKVLKQAGIDRTYNAVCEFVAKAQNIGVQNIYIFATAAVRNSKNSNVLLSKIKDFCGVEVDVVSGTLEAQLGALGALCNNDGAVVDIGGASTEVAVVTNGKIVYSHSISWGAVTLTDYLEDDMNIVQAFCDKIVGEYLFQSTANFYAIGGTATSIAFLLSGLSEYNPKVVNGFLIDINSLLLLRNKLYSMSLSERESIAGLLPGRARIIGCGVCLLISVMNRFNLSSIKVSESDNLEGYLSYKLGGAYE